MADEQSFLFDFSRVEDFFEQMNIKFNVADMVNSTADKFELVIVSNGYNNIDGYLDTDGCLDPTDIVIFGTESCTLDWVKHDYGDVTIELHDAVEFDIDDDDVTLKAIFLRDATTGYVMGYSINMSPFTVTNKVVFDDDVIFWDISRYKE